MTGKKINDSFKIRNLTIKNRICLPPIVCFSYNDSADGLVSRKSIEHYRTMAKGGAGLIIQEATCINPNGKLDVNQIGLWNDQQIEGAKKIVEAVHGENAGIFVQIHHAGVVGIGEKVFCPSEYTVTDREGKPKTGIEMTIEDIKGIQEDFINAAVRAQKAGYDGVELHGCHSYLICQFLNADVNTRTDEYGKNPISFVTEILEGIRKRTPEDFIVGIRLGAFEPSLEDGIRHAKELEAKGIDFIDVSYGFHDEPVTTVPKEFPYNEVIHGAYEIKKNVSIPVFAVNGIRTPADAKGIIEITNVDMVDVGRSMLVDSEWANKCLAEETPGKCLGCGRCIWARTPENCPGKKML